MFDPGSSPFIRAPSRRPNLGKQRTLGLNVSRALRLLERGGKLGKTEELSVP